jgi:hypothetical protein
VFRLRRIESIIGDIPRVLVIFSTILSDIISEAHGDDYLSNEDEDIKTIVSNSDSKGVRVRLNNTMCGDINC